MDERTLSAQSEVALNSVPSGSLDLVSFGKEVPSKETRKVLDCAVGLCADAVYIQETEDRRRSEEPITLSLPTVVLHVLRDCETAGWKTTCAAMVAIVRFLCSAVSVECDSKQTA